MWATWAMMAPMVRKMAQQQFLAAHQERVYDSKMPNAAPHYDPTQGRIVSLMSCPVPRTTGAKGSGFISYENDDPTAERIATIYKDIGLSHTHVFPWNASPWYLHEGLKDQRRRASRRQPPCRDDRRPRPQEDHRAQDLAHRQPRNRRRGTEAERTARTVKCDLRPNHASRRSHPSPARPRIGCRTEARLGGTHGMAHRGRASAGAEDSPDGCRTQRTNC